jgi:hypothetical protein
LIIKKLCIYEYAVKKKVILDILNRVLNLTLALRITGPAKGNLKDPARLIPLKNICHNIISAIFTVKKNGVLVIDYLPGYATEKLKSLLMVNNPDQTEPLIPDQTEPLIPEQTEPPVPEESEPLC